MLSSIIYITISIYLFSMILSQDTALNYQETNWPASCTGLQQSPIDLPVVNRVNYNMTNSFINILSSNYSLISGPQFILIHFYKYDLPVSTLNIGSLMVNKNFIIYKYDLIDIHFHVASEHTTQGASQDVEIHLVHKKDTNYLTSNGILVDPDSLNSLLVVGILFKATGTTINDSIRKLNINNLAPVNLLDLNPWTSSKKNYIHYSGGLTTPNCDQIVNWIVMEKIETMAISQLADFRNWVVQTYPAGNARMVKPLNGRTLYYVNNTYSLSASHLVFTFNALFLFLIVLLI